jgi:hypothetical protein
MTTKYLSSLAGALEVVTNITFEDLSVRYGGTFRKGYEVVSHAADSGIIRV